MRRLVLLLILLSFSSAQYQVYIVRANDTATTTLLYDDNSTSYADNSLENPDALLRICAMTAGELQNKYVSLMYADGTNPGDYIEITHFPVQVTYVPPNNCVYLPLDIHSFRAWYPSIPFVFISDTPDMSSAVRTKLLEADGWLVGNYTLTSSQSGNIVNVTVTAALDDNGAAITPDVNYLVVGLMMGSSLITTDTEITSPNNEVALSLGAYTGPYFIHINGIGPGLFPPNVTIITPQPTTYSGGTIPFTYLIIPSMAPIDSCWYVLDGTRVDMPDCTISYVLNVGTGAHTLFLFANDTAGNIGNDSVIFSVSAPTPPTPPHPGGGPGAPHIGIPFPVVPPAYDVFDINPENIRITIDYPEEGSADFSLYSLNSLVDVYCFVDADFGEYTTVELESDEIQAGQAIRGTITVDMPPDVILDYDKKTEGLLQCVGRRASDSTLLLSTTANVYLTINRPLVDVENVTVEMTAVDILLGEGKFANLSLTNMGNGSAYTYNMSAEFMGPYGNLIQVIAVPRLLQHEEAGPLSFFVSIPRDFAPGIYNIPVFIYENGRIVGRGQLTLFVKEPIGVTICIVPDLRWTVLILVLGAVLGTWLYKREKERLEKEERARRGQRMGERMETARAGERADKGREKPDRWRPHKYAAAAFLASLILWAIIVWLLMRCTYVTV